MTKFQKQMLTIAAAGALTAVTALPAMAFENEFHGIFQVRTYLGNFDRDGAANGAVQVNPRDKHKTGNYSDQRTRIQYTAKASDDLKLVTQLEYNTTWGDSASGGDIDTDANTFNVKHAYLDFNVGKSLNVKAGQQPYKDNLMGLYVDADLPMALVSYNNGGYKLALGYSRFNDAGGTAAVYRGDLNADLYLIDNTYKFNKDTQAGFVYYLNVDNSTQGTSNKINTLGAYAGTKIGALDLSGFAAMQAGSYAGVTKVSYHGWAANMLAKMKAGSGMAKVGFLFTSGDHKTNDGHNGGWQTLSSGRPLSTDASAGQNTYNDANMMILVRSLSTTAGATANYMRVPITNIALLHMGYDAQLTEKFNLNGNVGMAWVPKSANLNGGSASVSTHSVNGSDYMGTELNLEAGYKLYKNLTLKAQAAYVMLGGAYKGLAGTDAAPKDFANPWTTRLSANYSF